MPTHNYYFLKLHYDILDDWKVGTLPDSLKWRFIQCLCVAGEEFNDGLLPEISQFAFRIREEPSALHADMARLSNNGLVELVPMEEEPDRWFITNYKKRQARIPPKKKQRDYRARERQKEMAKSDAPVTPSLPERYDSVTIRNTEVDIDIEVEENRREVYVDSAHAENTPPNEVMSAIACVVKETLAPGFNEDKFETAARAIIALDAEDMIAGFSPWWERNSYYSDNGKPSIKSFLDEFQNYIDGVERTASPTNEQLTPVQQYVRSLEVNNVD